MNTVANIVYTVSDLDSAKAVQIALLGVQPHTDEPYYVGFNVGGFEIGLTPVQPQGSPSTVAHILVPDLEEALHAVQEAGAVVTTEPRDVGGGTRVAAVRDPAGTLVGLLENNKDS